MFPTVDLSNFIKKAVLAVGWVWINPIPRTIALALAVTASWVSVVAIFDFIPLPQIPVDAIAMGSSDYVKVIMYAGALDIGFDIVNRFIILVYWTINFVGSLTVGLTVAMWAFKTKEVIGRAYTHLVH